MGDKTEQPTPKRLREARKRGQIAFSRDVTGVATYLAGMSLILVWASRIGDAFQDYYRTVTSAIGQVDGASLTTVWARLLDQAGSVWLWSVGPILGGVAVAGLALAAAQAGLNMTFEPMKPSLKKLNPLEGLKRWFSIRGIIEFIKTLVKVLVVVLLGYAAISGNLEAILRLHWADMGAFYRVGTQVAQTFIFQVGATFLLIAGLDYFYQRRQWKKQLMMTKEEVKQEYKEMEGDPIVKSQRKALHQAMVMQDIQREVPKADVVVTNPTHIAVAIRYDRATMGAPKVTAKGRGLIAQKIIQLAKKHDVPIVRDISLAHALFEVEMGRYIPRDLYEAVAEVLLFAWRLKQEAQRFPGI
ncbi:MAG: flagellar biosynthesis protein FlhB [Acidobacteria bacterium]|nr:flagellar biosynthesis protein FlhB [Acidobacteriota bacterium]MDW7984214.1 flagellar biosynthesis protein FlhB [Acidobacteriota bacterium]